MVGCIFANTISRVLYSLAGASIIYLRLRSPAASSNLPPDIGRATLNCRYTRSCNPQCVLPANITAAAVGSYPTFSPLPKCLPSTPKPHDLSTQAPRRLFSVTLLHPYEHRAVNSCGALRCSDFPLPLRAAIERISSILLDKPANTSVGCHPDIVMLTAHQRTSPNHGNTIQSGCYPKHCTAYRLSANFS